jgi:hypothetical protein
MKNVVIAFVIFLTMIGIMAFSLNYMNKQTSRFRVESDRLESLIKEHRWDEAAKSSNEMLEQWKKQATILPMFVNHTEIDNLTNELLKLTQYVETKTIDESLASTHVVKFWLDNIKALQKINFENIF